MKVAVMLPGYLRAWEYCKQNFIENIIDSNHQVDIFVDTYDQMFRTDYDVRNENQLKVKKTEKEIVQLFYDLNVVSLSVEPEIIDGTFAEYLQIRKLRKIYNSVVEYEKQNGQYDLIIKSRPDLKLKSKLDYDLIYHNCSINPNLIIIPDNKTVNVGWCQNDLFAIAGRKAGDTYMKRFDVDEKYFKSNAVDAYYRGVHGTLSDLINQGIVFDNTFQLILVRIDGNKNVIEVG